MQLTDKNKKKYQNILHILEQLIFVVLRVFM